MWSTCFAPCCSRPLLRHAHPAGPELGRSSRSVQSGIVRERAPRKFRRVKVDGCRRRKARHSVRSRRCVRASCATCRPRPRRTPAAASRVRGGRRAAAVAAHPAGRYLGHEYWVKSRWEDGIEVVVFLVGGKTIARTVSYWDWDSVRRAAPALGAGERGAVSVVAAGRGELRAHEARVPAPVLPWDVGQAVRRATRAGRRLASRCRGPSTRRKCGAM